MSLTNGTGRTDSPKLAVIGGGVAGIAAAESASREGFQVDLFEWSRVLGGRAGSLYDPVAGHWIDNGQHLLLGCCTETLALHARLGLSAYFERKDSIPFAQDDGKHWVMSASPYLPSRWQLAPAFLKIPFLSFKDRLATGLLLRKLGKRTMSANDRFGKISFADWLASEQVSSKTIEKFWAPLVFSTLSETVESASFQAVQKVVRDGFLAGKEAMSVHIPTLPLRAIYHDVVSRRLRESGVRLHFFSRVRKLHWKFSTEDESSSASPVPRVTALELSGGGRVSFDRYVLAIPVSRIWELLEASDLDPFAERLGLDRFEPGAITSVHLWFDRRILPADESHTALLGGPGQFFFCPQREPDASSKLAGVYHTVVISASHRLLSEGELTSRGSEPLVDRVVKQLQTTFPNVFRSGTHDNPPELVHSRVTTFFDAVFSPSPTVYSSRPLQETPFSNLALAGDWTQTHWPSTLEGAVRSGIRAVAVLKDE